MVVKDFLNAILTVSLLHYIIYVPSGHPNYDLYCVTFNAIDHTELKT